MNKIKFLKVDPEIYLCGSPVTGSRIDQLDYMNSENDGSGNIFSAGNISGSGKGLGDHNLQYMTVRKGDELVIVSRPKIRKTRYFKNFERR